MKKKLLSFFTLAVIGVLAYAATQISRRAGETVIWSSESATYCTNISIEAEKFADVKVGDTLVVEVENTNTESIYNSQVQILNSDGKKLEGGINVGQAADGTLVKFTIVGDVLKQLKAGGMKLGGYGYSSKQVSLKSGDATGSDNAIWIGSVTNANIDAIDLIHFANANNFTGVKVGDIIRVSFDKTSWVEGTSGWVQLQYKKGSGYTWTQISGEGHSETTVTNSWNGDPVDFTIKTAELAAELNDATNNHGLIVQVGGSTTVTSVELIPTYAVNIGEGITGGKVSVDKAIAAEGDEVTITAVPNEGYKVKSYSVTGVNTNLAVTVNNGKFKMPADAVTVSVTFNQSVDVTISPASGDISEALNAAIAELGNNDAKNITINLAENATYTISAPIVAPASVTINGNGATIDASALEGNFIQMAAIEASSAWTEANVTVKGITVKGLKKALFYSGCKQYFGDVVVDNCVVELAADATTFDYTKGSTAVNFTVTNSTFYAPTATTKSFYSSQGGQKTTEYNGDAKQTFTFANNTMYNLAYNKNFFSHRQSNQTWYVYNVQNNIFVNCGKSGQVIKGMNGGQNGKNPTWNIKGNVFNYGGADTSAAEDTGDTTEGENVQNSLKGYVIFKDAAKGEFDGIFALPLEATAPATMPGDPRWTIEAQTSYAITIAEGIENGTVTTTPAGYAPKGTKVAVKATPASGFATESISVMEGENKVSLDKDDNFTMPEAAVTVNATFSKAPVAITVAAEDITSGDINAAIDAKIAALAEGEKAGDITITLAADATYTLTKSIEAPASLTINGSGATIDASALESAMIVTPTGDLTRWMVGNLIIKDVTIKGLQKSLFVSAGKNYLYNDFLIENSIIEFNETAGCEFDFRKGGVAKNFTINNSTLYALSATGNSLYTSQSAQKGTDAPGVTVQTFAITNSTLYNFAKSKNFFSHRQANQTFFVYDIENNIFVDCGKSGQVVKGLNGGQGGANPTWTIKGNVFNYDGADTSAAEDTGDADEPVQNSIVAIVTFEDTAAGKFNAQLGVPVVPADPIVVGDPRWTLTVAQAPFDIVVNAADITEGDITAAIATASAGKMVKGITVNLAAETAYKVTAPIAAAGNIVINGAAGASIDASALEGAMVTMTATEQPTDWTTLDKVEIKNVKITGLKQALYATTVKNYLIKNFTLDNSIVDVAADVTVFDFTKGSVVENFTINKSTLYSATATTKSLYSSQSGQKASEVSADQKQTIKITNSTLYNFAKSKNFFSHRQANQTFFVYDIENNIFVDCGKSGQVVKGLNGGQGGANPTWTIKGNVFNFNGADTSANEETGDSDHTGDETPGANETVQNSYAGRVIFTDAATGDFNFTFLAAPETTAPTAVGDPRWTLTAGTSFTITIGEVKNGKVAAVAYAAEGEKVYPTLTPDAGYAVDKLPVIKNAEGTDVTETITFDEDEAGLYFVMPAFNITVDYEFSKLYTITLPTETTNGTVTIVKPAEGNQSVAGKEVKIKVTGLADGYKVVVKNGDTDVMLNEGDHTNYDYYFTMPEGDVTISIVDGTGINGIYVDGEAADIFSDGKPVYNLSGQRVFKGYKGVVIKNGRKVVIK